MIHSMELKPMLCGIVGMGISTRGVLRYLYDRGVERVHLRSADTFCADTPLPPFPHITQTVGKDYLEHIDEDILFLSPSVRRDIPPLQRAQANGTHLCSDAELFFDGYRGTAFCITGSDGKSTTTGIVERLLETGPFAHVCAGGNIGIALSPLIGDSRPDDACAVELSSFQLMYMHPRCRRALITGITENHLNWHSSMEEYTEAKGHIYTHASECIVNIDDPLCRSLARGRPPYAVYSMKESASALARAGAHVAVHLRDDGIFADERKLLSLKDISIPGRHTVQNFMAAIATAYGFFDTEAVSDIANTFRGLPHRAERVGTVHGVTYVDASIDSSPTRTLTTLASLATPPILILCGRSKNLSTQALVDALPRAALGVICAGEFGAQMYDILTRDGRCTACGIPVLYTDTLEEAVTTAAHIAREGDTVLLSPGATSFDAYRTFEERGRAFTAAVEALKT